MHKDRLLMLANVLDNVTPEKFDLGCWRKQSECGTTACAVGWAMVTPAFNKLGLTSYSYDYEEGIHLQIPVYGEEEGFNAVMSFFDITRDVAVYLFTYEFYDKDYINRQSVTPAMVAERIRALVGPTKLAAEPRPPATGGAVLQERKTVAVEVA